MADTHELHREADVPDGDILIHAGDFTSFSKNASAIADFNDWLGTLPHRHKIVVPGNHEFFLEADPSRRRLISNATVLIDESIDVLGLNIWGSPTTPLYGGAFGKSSEQDRIQLYSRIPVDTDILITHGPPFGILDRSPESDFHQGCGALLDQVRQIKPRIHIFGHAHGAYGTFHTDKTIFVNAALHGTQDSLGYKPIVLEIPQIGP